MSTPRGPSQVLARLLVVRGQVAGCTWPGMLTTAMVLSAAGPEVRVQW